MFPAGLANELVFLEREREWFLAEDVLPGLQRFNRDLHVPVVRGHDAHDVDVVPLQHPPVVPIRIRATLANALVVLRLSRMVGIHVTHGQDVTKPLMVRRVSLTHTPHTHTADPQPVVGGGTGERGASPGKIGYGARGGQNTE